jgi:hypothetical protein
VLSGGRNSDLRLPLNNSEILNQGEQCLPVVAHDAEHGSAAGANHIAGFCLAGTAITERASGEFVGPPTDWALAALGFRAGAEGAVFPLIGGLLRGLARPASVVAGPVPIRQIMVAAVAVEGGHASGLEGLPFGLKTFAALALGSNVEFGAVQGGQSLRPLSDRVRLRESS